MAMQTKSMSSFERRLERAAQETDVLPHQAQTVVGEWAAPASLWTGRMLGHPPRTAFEMWLSLFPFSPLLGVRWFWANAFGPNQGAAPVARAGRETSADLAERAARENQKLAMGGRMVGAPVAEAEKLSAAPSTAAPGSGSQPVRAETPPPLQQTSRRPEAVERTPFTAASEPPGRTPSEDAPAPAQPTPSPSEPATPAEPSETPKAGAATAQVAVYKDAVRDARPEMAVSTGVVIAGTEVVKPANLLASRPVIVDDLTRIHGIGERLQELLNELGVYQLKQLADMTPAEMRWIDEQLHVFKGRSERDAWGAQARTLVAQDAQS